MNVGPARKWSSLAKSLEACQDLPGSARICDLPEPFPGRATHQLHRHIVQLFHATPSCPHTFSPRNLEHFTALCMPKVQGPKQGIFTLSALQCLSGPTALCHAAMPLARVSLEIVEHRSFSMLFSSFHLFSFLFISFHLFPQFIEFIGNVLVVPQQLDKPRCQKDLSQRIREQHLCSHCSRLNVT